MAIDIRDNTAASRYEILEDGAVVGIADYRLEGSVAVFPHTEIVASRRGEGLGAQLVKFALDDQRAAGHRVDARCWYVAEFLEEHPEYDDLRASA
jgi:uncharacterized protein